VMELVEGPNLERLLEARRLDVATVLDLLDGIAAGLEAMHAAGIAHLDLKPANVIVRDAPGQRRAPVLVDFGLAGRRVRPGCGTLDYSAPEIWGSSPATRCSTRPTRWR
jgi:serine/threonine protein kinase